MARISKLNTHREHVRVADSVAQQLVIKIIDRSWYIVRPIYGRRTRIRLILRHPGDGWVSAECLCIQRHNSELKRSREEVCPHCICVAGVLERVGLTRYRRLKMGGRIEF